MLHTYIVAAIKGKTTGFIHIDWVYFVYIILEPVGSARLTFDDDLYYELCVLVTEVCSESRMRSRT